MVELMKRKSGRPVNSSKMIFVLMIASILAFYAYNKIVTNSVIGLEKEEAIKNLKTYCGLDTYAMYSIWRALYKLL